MNRTPSSPEAMSRLVVMSLEELVVEGYGYVCLLVRREDVGTAEERFCGELSPVGYEEASPSGFGEERDAAQDELK